MQMVEVEMGIYVPRVLRGYWAITFLLLTPLSLLVGPYSSSSSYVLRETSTYALFVIWGKAQNPTVVLEDWIHNADKPSKSLTNVLVSAAMFLSKRNEIFFVMFLEFLSLLNPQRRDFKHKIGYCAWNLGVSISRMSCNLLWTHISITSDWRLSTRLERY